MLLAPFSRVFAEIDYFWHFLAAILPAKPEGATFNFNTGI
jgi:hypothetical protein